MNILPFFKSKPFPGRRGHLLEGGAQKLFQILEEACIGRKRLKEGGRFLEDLPYSAVAIPLNSITTLDSNQGHCPL